MIRLMKRNQFLILSLTVLCFMVSGVIKAEEFVPKRAHLEKDGEKVEITDLSKFPSFYVDYHPEENIVVIQCSAGKLVLRKGIFFYGYSGTHKGLKINARAYVENNKIEQIVYEEHNEFNNVIASISYFKK